MQERTNNLIASPLGSAPDYDTQFPRPKFENPFDTILPITEYNKPAEVAGFAHIQQARQVTQEVEKPNYTKTPSFVLELIKSIAELGHGVFSVSFLLVLSNLKNMQIGVSF